MTEGVTDDPPDSMYYQEAAVNTATTTDHIRDLARQSDELRRESAKLMRMAVREGRAAGLSQRAIADAVGRSQPEVSRLLRFSPTTPRGQRLHKHRSETVRLIRQAGFTDVRVFGSVARGDDGADSDIDLLVTPLGPYGLFALAELEEVLQSIIGDKVDVVPDDSLREPIASHALAEAVPL